MNETYTKPIPIPSEESLPFWEACRRHELRLQRCAACQRYWFPPSNVCPECLSDQWEWAPASGRGTVFSFVVFHRVYHPGFRDAVPYPVAIIALDEGPRFLSNIVDCPIEDIRVGMPVEVVFEDVTDDCTLPKFRPVT
ncbi:MAG TPA: Zn-ribbon domain-containing OB-fold protein [Chloroflexota bacterium]|nr:Zn-ribbon domain-containing OB-fold protein [Chloroflexota bacterium]